MKFVPYVIMIALLALLVLSVVYLSKKAILVFGIDQIWLAYVGIGLLVVFFLVGSVALVNSTGVVGHTLYKIASIAMGVYLFLILSFLVVDAFSIFISIAPRTYGIIGIGMTLIVSIYGYWNSTNIRLTELNIPIKGLEKEIKAVHLTDTHIGHFRVNGFLQKIIDKTNAQNPDVIFLTGDYLDSKYALNKTHFEPLKQLNAPMYFVDGNHDKATDNDSIIALMRSVGVTVLENEVTHFNGLQIAGLNHMLADRNSFDMHASGDNPTVDETLQKLNIDKEKPTVLLHHAPNGIKHANQYGIDLYLAGHTHAGQIFPFTIFSNLIFEYNRGLHDYMGTKVLVSEGIGTMGPPFRIGTKSEVVSLTLSPNN